MLQTVKLNLGLFLALSALACVFCGAVSGVERSRTGDLVASARVPFVRNDGQIADGGVKYYARTFGGTVYALADGRIVYRLPKLESGRHAGSVALTENLLNGAAAGVRGLGKSRASVSSFVGSDPAGWKAGLPAFDRLDFGEVYGGVDFMLAAHGNNVEKIFVLAPGADYRQIGFRYEGALGLEITPDGQLEVQTDLGPVYFSRPVAWTVDGGLAGKTSNVKHPTFNFGQKDLKFNVQSSALNVESFGSVRVPVDVAYVLDEDGTVGFELGAYDRNKALVIDPLLASTFIGGGGGDAIQAMVVDGSTNVYVAGYTDSSDFPTNNGAYRSLAGNYDAFVSKIDGNLGTLAASTYLGGSSNDQAFALGIASNARVWVAGYTESANFPVSRTTPLAAYTNYSGNGDAFVAILGNNLDSLYRATYVGGSDQDSATAIAINNSNQYVVGYTRSANFPVRGNPYMTNYVGNKDGFALLFTNDVTTNAYLDGTYLGGTEDDAALATALETNNSYLVVAGYTASADFPVSNAYQRTFAGSNDAFVARLGALLTNLVGSTFLGGTGNDIAYAVGLDLSNRIYVAGSTHSSDFPRNPATDNVYLDGYTNRYWGGEDIFVSCLTNNAANSNSLYASTYLGGPGDDVPAAIAVSSTNGYVYLAGYTASSNFPATRNAYRRTLSGGEDAFVMYLGSRLTNICVSTLLGGGANDRALALRVSADTGMIFVAGITASSDFPASDTAYQNYFGGGAGDGFISKFPASLANGTLKWKKFLNGDICSSPAMTLDGLVVFGGATSLIAYARSGVQRWELPTTSAIAEYTGSEGLGNPAVGTNNLIHINMPTGKVYAVSASGVISWIFDSGQPFADHPFWSAIAFNSGGDIFFGQKTKLLSVTKNGAGIWTNSSLPAYTDPAPSVSSNGIIYAVSSSEIVPSRLYGFNSSGSYSNIATISGGIYSSPALDTNGHIYVAGSNKLYSFHPDGATAMVWQTTGYIYSSPAIGTNGYVYIGGGSSLYAFHPDGTTVGVWSIGGTVKSSPALAADGSIIVGSGAGAAATNIYSFNPDGTTNWVFASDDYTAFQSPLIDSEGTIYVSDDSSIYALYGDYAPAESSWPMYRRDALRTGNQGTDIAGFLRPAGLTATKGTYTNYIRVAWNASSNAISYELWRNTGNSSATATRIRRLTQTNYNDSSIDAGVVYHYWVKVKTPVALSSFSSEDAGGVPPYPPAGVSASGGVPTNCVELTWNASSNATTYYVFRSLENSTSAAVQINSTSATNYSDAAVAPGIRHYYWVKAGNSDAGLSGFSSPSASGGIPSWPPAGLAASQSVNFHQVDLTWNSSTGAASYLVYRNTDNTPAGAALLTNITDTSLSDVSVIPLRRYYYWVRVTNDFGLSGFSDSASGWCLLTPPQKVLASEGTYSNMIRVSWVVGSTDATAYVVFRSETANVSDAVRYAEVVYNSASATNYDDTGITRGISYYYWLAAKDPYGSSTWVAADSPGATPPNTPTDLSATDGIYSNMIRISWTVAPGAMYYTVYRAETYDPAQAAVMGSSLTNFYEDRSAIYGVLYYYWVKAFNNYGASDFSTFNSGWRGMIPPADITASDGNSTNEVSIGWSGAPGATSYEVWRGASSNISSAGRLANNVATESYRDLSAAPGTVYYYWIKSKRGIYASAFSGYDSGYRAIGTLDIAVSDFVFLPPVNGPLAKPSAVSFNVANLSPTDLIEPNNAVRYDFYLSRSPVYGADELFWFGGTNSTLTLNAGSATRVVLSKPMRQIISIPVWATGVYYIFVFINHTLPSGWQDPNLANNVALRLGNTLTVAAITPIQPIWDDFDGDGKTDFAVFNDSLGAWIAWLSGSGYAAAGITGLGVRGTRAVSRDYDGDGRTDPAVYHDVSGAWQVCLSGSGYQSVLVVGLGGVGQTAIPADYDGDGLIDPAVYQAGGGLWRLWLSASGYVEFDMENMGGIGWTAAPADYDGDQYTDPAVYNESAGTWRIWLSGSAYVEAVASGWGGAGQIAAPADYDGDGKIDPAVYESATGKWRVWVSSGSYRENSVTGWGGAGQYAVPGDYDGDGKVDPVVYWESLGVWRIWASSFGYVETDLLATGGEGYHAITAGE